MRRITRMAVAAALVLAACTVQPPQPPEGAPKLVLLLVVDQLGADHLVRFNDVFEGGLRRLLDEGVSFTEAHHAHAGTLTAPGHATIATGCHPSSHGVISNWWIDPATGDQVYAVDDPRHGKAPTRLECSTLGDWVKGGYPASKVYSLSAKDRSAILMGGRRADGAYWYDWDGTFTSSSYYRDANPTWLDELNSEGFLAGKFGQVWEPLAFDAEQLQSMDVVVHELGPLEEKFPHAIGGLSVGPGDSFFNEVYESPWLDEYMLQVARGVISARQLGVDAYPDVLSIGFSTSDSVGHGYGPGSREFFDILVRLDRQLGEFFLWLDETVGMENVAIALSSDHGSVPLPEMRMSQGLSGGRVGVGEIGCFQRAEAALDEEFGEADWLLRGPFFGPVPPDSEVSETEVRERARELFEACPSVSRVWLADELTDEAPGEGQESEMQRRFARSYFEGRSPDLAIEWDEYFLKSASVASSHGTPHRYDTHVPIVLWRPGGGSGTVGAPVRTVDIAPTLAGWAGADVPLEVDGSNLDELPLDVAGTMSAVVIETPPADS